MVITPPGSCFVKQGQPKISQKIFEGLRDAGIGVQLHYEPVHLQPFTKLGFNSGNFPNAEAYTRK